MPERVFRVKGEVNEVLGRLRNFAPDITCLTTSRKICTCRVISLLIMSSESRNNIYQLRMPGDEVIIYQPFARMSEAGERHEIEV